MEIRFYAMSTKTIHPKNLLSKNELEKYDLQEMYKTYDMWPEMAASAFESDVKKIDFNGVSNIVFAGMGGSGAINDIFASILSKTKIHISSVKSHIIPNSVDANSLVVTTSVSGNTIETLTILDAAKKAGCKIIGFSSGGKMQQYCNQNRIEHRNIPLVHSPRSSFISFLYSMINVLDGIISIRKEDVRESIFELEKTREQIRSANLTETNSALELALWISGIPLIYYPQGLHASAVRFKNSLQENAKLHVMTEEVGEACHNGVVSWEIPSNVQPVLVRGKDDHVQTKARWSVFKKFFDDKEINYKEIFTTKGSLLTKLINLNYLFDYSSIYCAVLSKVDPSPISSINYFKQQLMINQNF